MISSRRTGLGAPGIAKPQAVRVVCVGARAERTARPPERCRLANAISHRKGHGES